MDEQLLGTLYHRLIHGPEGKCRQRSIYSDGLIALIYLFAVLKDRSPLWAQNLKHWPLWVRARLSANWPSYSQLQRRLKRPSLWQLLERLLREYRQALPAGAEKILDGKPLVVGGFSKDRDAKRGKVPDGWARGYKLHVLIDAGSGAVEAFRLSSMNDGEPTVAAALLRPLLDAKPWGWLVRADSNYDSNDLYGLIAAASGRLLAPRKKPQTGLGHHPQHSDRLRAITELEQAAEAAGEHKRHRNRVEQSLAHLTNLPYGLSPLPNFVRRPVRVARWVAAKILLYHLHLSLCPSHSAAA